MNIIMILWFISVNLLLFCLCVYNVMIELSLVEVIADESGRK